MASAVGLFGVNVRKINEFHPIDGGEHDVMTWDGVGGGQGIMFITLLPLVEFAVDDVLGHVGAGLSAKAECQGLEDILREGLQDGRVMR